MASTFSASSEDIDLQWLLRTLRRRMWAIVLPAVLTAMVVAAFMVATPSYYDATSSVMIDPRETKLPDLQSVLSGMLTDDEAMASELAVISSRDLAYRVVDFYDLVNDPEFNDDIDPSEFSQITSGIKDWIKTQLIAIGLKDPPKPQTPEEETAAEKAGVVDNYLDALSPELVTKSRVISITFRSMDPERAANVANKVADLYVREGLEAHYDATRRATEFLTGKIADLRQTVDASDRAVEKFRSQAGLLQTNAGTLLSQQISDLNGQLILVRASRAEAEARLSQARQLIRTSGSAEAAQDVLKSPIVQQLIEQETQTKLKVAELNDEYGARHPRMVAAKAELADVQAKIKREVSKVVNGLENEVGIARAREETLQKSLDSLKSQLSQSNASEVKLRALQLDADADRAMLQTFLNNVQQTSSQLDSSVNDSNARVISHADIPDKPAFPPKTLIVLVAFIASGLLAALIVLGIEQMDSGYRSGAQVEKGTGLRTLSLIPLTRSGTGGKNPADYLLRHPSSMFGESIRTLYTSILLSPAGKLPRKLLVTSSQPKEGKTTIALCLGRMRALAGHSTVIIEADLRRPSLHRLLNVPRRPGLTELILGEVQLSDVLIKDAESGAYVIPAGKLAPDPTEILSSTRMSALLSELAEKFELVVVDSPPVVAVADSRLLVPQVDSAILVVGWAKTSRDVVGLAAKQLQEAGGNVAGAVLSMVDSKKHAKYGFADSAYYYGPVRRYYTS
ncbi:MAG: polysaccharide biosynthesis tyrosine autokinase [Rhodospirillales bacterium]|nr:polysaccharide biosynthesis tyrosine autokinase [Rhodospirillales bacterium]